MHDWRNIDKDAIFTGKDENGNRYLSQFLQEYKQVFAREEINAGCKKCLDSYYEKLIKYLTKMGQKKPSNYKLKEKYNGISLGFGSSTIVSNRNITDKLAEKLLKDHPRGADLFEKMPEPSEKNLKNMTRPELDEFATQLGLEPSDFSKKPELLAAIEGIQNAEESDENQENDEESE